MIASLVAHRFFFPNKNGVGLTAQDQLVYNKYLAAAAHARGLLIALKNDVSQVRCAEGTSRVNTGYEDGASSAGTRAIDKVAKINVM